MANAFSTGGRKGTEVSDTRIGKEVKIIQSRDLQTARSHLEFQQALLSEPAVISPWARLYHPENSPRLQNAGRQLPGRFLHPLSPGKWHAREVLPRLVQMHVECICTMHF